VREIKFLKFVSLLQELKDVKRTGWEIYKVKDPESVSDHSFTLAILSMLFAKEMKLNVEKCIKMALIHDIGEIYTKDIATRAKESDQIVSNKVKEELEEKATKKVLSVLPKKYQKELFNLWKEFRGAKSKEAILVKDLDKIEMVLQAWKYKKRTEKDLDEFFRVANRDVKKRRMRKVLSIIQKEYGKLK
jgi:putative hydrolase of HD superfamily